MNNEQQNSGEWQVVATIGNVQAEVRVQDTTTSDPQWRDVRIVEVGTGNVRREGLPDFGTHAEAADDAEFLMGECNSTEYEVTEDDD